VEALVCKKLSSLRPKEFNIYLFAAPPPPQVATKIGTLMNNGARDVSNGDIQKLQQQLQDIKEQVLNHSFN